MGVFSLNFQELYELDVTPQGASRTWVRLGAGISSADPSNNENIDQSAYIVDDGYGSSEVIGAQKTISFSGHRVVGDSAQDYIANIQYSLGNLRKTNFRFYDAGGNYLLGACTIANIDIGGGDAAAKTEIAFEIHFNGKPAYTPKSIAPALTATIAAGSVIGTTKATATAGVGNTLRYNLTGASVGSQYANQYVDGGITYTSGADIVATAGQFLQVYEVSPFGRLVKFIEVELAAGDIKSA
jgi:hypothetical protein